MIAPTPLHIPDSSCAWRYLALDCVTSTNDIALQQAASGAAEGLVITAGQQTEGRGRRGREWFAEPNDALLMSLLLRPEWLKAADTPQLSLLAALALYHAVEADGKRVKWPNDLLVHGSKLAGILTELRAAPADQTPVVVVGIGVNLRTPSDGWPHHLRQPATALDCLGQPSLDAKALMQSIICSFNRHYRRYRDGGFSAIADQWWQAHGGEQQVEIDDGRQRWKGVAVGLDDDGALRVRDHRGEHRIVAADVTPLTEGATCC